MGGHENGYAASGKSEVVYRFLPDAEIVSIRKLGEGNINDTSLVILNNHPAVVLQKINGNVFADPAAVAVNGWLVTEHLCWKQAEREDPGRVPIFTPTCEGRKYYQDHNSGVWRMQYFLENTITCDLASASASAYEGGKLLGRFHFDLADFSSEQLSVSIPGFHDLPGYCSSFRAAERQFCGNVTDDVVFCIQEIEKRLNQATILEDAWKSGAIQKRLVHGDPKSANMLLDSVSGSGVAVIDLDTVARGLLIHDLGDCLRSFCNPIGETPGRSDSVVFDTGRCEQVLRGYADSGARLSRAEQELLYQGIRLMTYELSMRFLTDFLLGNCYFKVRHPFENLQRAKTQIQLLHSIEEQRKSIEELASSVFP